MKKDDNKDERFNELVKRMKTFNELLGDYLDALDMEEGDSVEADGEADGEDDADSDDEDKGESTEEKEDA